MYHNYIIVIILTEVSNARTRLDATLQSLVDKKEDSFNLYDRYNPIVLYDLWALILEKGTFNPFPSATNSQQLTFKTFEHINE